ncbi:hypothetical protein [Paenibacillus mesophilus]|uniref:hypothetical protein n=1 Tax=Paenibacillus mesophilus TaxID=2582849 RepID=UPI0013051CD4|nr:hypothetical protein [Paenibacillus mesophilus]
MNGIPPSLAGIDKYGYYYERSAADRQAGQTTFSDKYGGDFHYCKSIGLVTS